MKPNLESAAEKAIATVSRFELPPRNTDPLTVLKRLLNVYIISHDSPDMGGANQDAITLVNKAESGLQYIVIYNSCLDPHKLRFALARELAHVILKHDGSSPEDVWSAEANCFAYHFLCPLPLMQTVRINYRPTRICLSWEMKDSIAFDSIAELKSHIADERNRFNRFIGIKSTCDPADVEIVRRNDYDQRIGWKNCYDVMIDGKIIGYCGE